jgi:hypothetical protein
MNFNNFFQSLRIIHATLLVCMIAFLVIVRFIILKEADIHNALSTKSAFFYLSPAALFISIIAGWAFFQNLNKKYQNQALEFRLNYYRKAFVIRWVLLAIAVLWIIGLFLQTADKYFLGVALVGMAFFAFLRPAPEKCTLHLRLNQSDASSIRNN